MSDATGKLWHLVQFCDSALPVGGFSFSAALESAAGYGVVEDEPTLKSYAQATLNQMLKSDCVAALHTLRKGNIEEALLADRELTACKLSAEQRLMSTRMGRKLAELSLILMPEEELLIGWAERVKQGLTSGNHAISQALLFSAAGLGERELFVAQSYGSLSIVLNAALRCVRISHLTTQRILQELSHSADEQFAHISGLSLSQMQSFAPQADIFSSLHERGEMRMFMN